MKAPARGRPLPARGEFLVLVAAAAGLAGLDAIWIGVVMFGAWLLVALVERTGSRRLRATAEPSRPEPDPNRSQSRRRSQTRTGSRARAGTRARASAGAGGGPASAPGARARTGTEPEPAVVPLVLRDSSPRTWNLWELERLAETMNGDDIAAEERGLLLLHLREFADASGDLPVEFDSLVRDAFGADLAGLPR